MPRLPDSPNTLPANASHTVGVGALVTNSEATWTAILQIFEISMQCDVLQLVAKMTSLSNKPCKTGQGKILLVREKSGPAAKHGFWKIPTGLVDAGEVTLQQRGSQFSDDSHSVATLSFLELFNIKPEERIGHSVRAGFEHVLHLPEQILSDFFASTSKTTFPGCPFFDFRSFGLFLRFSNQQDIHEAAVREVKEVTFITVARDCPNPF